MIRYCTFTTSDTNLLQRAERGKPGTLYLPWEHLACPEGKDLIEATEIYWFSTGYPVSKGRTRLKARRTWQQEAFGPKGQSPSRSLHSEHGCEQWASQITHTVWLITAGLHFGEIKQYRTLKRLERVDRGIPDLHPASCVIFAMSKSSPRKTIGAPAPGEGLAAVQTHRAVTASQALGATQKDNAGTRREDLK